MTIFAMRFSLQISLTLLLSLDYVACNSSATSAGEKSVSTSIASLEALLKLEEVMMNALKQYADELQAKLDTVRSGIIEMQKEMEKARSDSEAYLSNPLNSFALIRHMHSDWASWVKFMTRLEGAEHSETILLHLKHMPTKQDITEATMGISRLTKTYDMKPKDMVQGVLNGKKYDARLSSIDSYTLGCELLANDDFFEAAHWLYEALFLYKENDFYKLLGFDKSQIYESYAETMLKQNRLQDALLLLNDALKTRQGDVNILARKAEIARLMALGNTTATKYEPPILTTYEIGCRGQFEYPKNNSHLLCHYKTSTHPFLKLAPIKSEIIEVDPYIEYFHDIITAAEIEDLKNLARPHLERATIFDDISQKARAVNTRTSQFSWFGPEESKSTKAIHQRLYDMTGLEMQGSELLQVMNYGLGGHYSLHYDYFKPNDKAPGMETEGNRIATVLFYMNDVEQGGATVFPLIDVAVFPRKGTAVMWFNLNERGEGNPDTLHAACPVIVGSKWVSNKWIRERSQIFRKPCPSNR